MAERERAYLTLAKRAEALSERLKRISDDSDAVLEEAQKLKRQASDYSPEWQEAVYVMSVMLALQRDLTGNWDNLAGVDAKRAKEIIRADT